MCQITSLNNFFLGENAQESDLAHFLIIEHFFEFKPQQNLSFDISTFTITLILEFMSIIPFQFIVKPFGDNFSWSPSTTFLIWRPISRSAYQTPNSTIPNSYFLFTFRVFFPDKSFKSLSKYTQKSQYNPLYLWPSFLKCWSPPWYCIISPLLQSLYIKKKKTLSNTSLNWGN